MIFTLQIPLINSKSFPRISVLPLAKLEPGPGTNSSRKLLVWKKVSGPSQDEFVEYTIYNTDVSNIEVW